MTSPTGSIRPLRYPLTQVLSLESTLGAENVPNVDLSNWSTNDPDERVDIVLNLSLNEYVALASTIDVGRDVAYGDNSLYIWYLWVRVLETMTICASIIDCIENDYDVRNAINNAINGLPDTEGSESQYGQEAFPPVVGCDEDVVWGYVDALWEYINQNNIDFLEQLNEATNQAGQIQTLLQLIPGMEQIPVLDVLGWIENLGEYNLDAYNASITVGLTDQIKCDLFCIALENGCTITFGDVYNYMVEQLGGVNVPTLGATFSELVFFMVSGSYPSDRIVFLWSVVQLGFAFIGARFLGIKSIQPYAIQAQAGQPDDAWESLCDTCLWESVLDLTIEDYSFVFDKADDGITDVGQYVLGVGLQAVNVVISGGNTTWLKGRWDFDDSTISYLKVEGSFTKASGQVPTIIAWSSNVRLSGVGTGLGVFQRYNEFADNVATPISKFDDDPTAIGNMADLSIRPDNSGFGGAATITKVTLRGTGIKPGQLP